MDLLQRDHIEIANIITDLVRCGRSETCFGGLIETLKSVCLTHFQREEAAMAQVGYPDADDHAAWHRQILDTIDRIAGRFAATGEGGDVEFLLHLILDHQMYGDRPLFDRLGIDWK